MTACDRIDGMKIENRTIAEKLSLSQSAISLIRAGKRFPRMSTMEAIEKGFGWKVSDQVDARGNYPEAFNRAVQDYYSKHGING